MEKITQFGEKLRENFFFNNGDFTKIAATVPLCIVVPQSLPQLNKWWPI